MVENDKIRNLGDRYGLESVIFVTDLSDMGIFLGTSTEGIKNVPP